MDLELSSRDEEVLQHVVESYVSDAQPVSSAAVVARIKGDKPSPALIRSVMARLEHEGLLHQPHTSAGRIPTESGLRVYLNRVVSRRTARKRDRQRLDAAFGETEDVSELPTRLGAVLSQMTGQLAVITVPRFLGSAFKEFGLARCDAGRFLAYFVSPGGLVQQKLVTCDFDLDETEINYVCNYLNERLAKRSIEELRASIAAELEVHALERSEIERRAVAIGAKALPDPKVDVVLEGTSQLAAQPEFSDVDGLRALIRAIERKDVVLQLVDSILDDSKVTVLLGSEHEVDGLQTLSCVGSRLIPYPREVTVGLLGPARMNYPRLIPLVGYARELLGRYWNQL